MSKTELFAQRGFFVRISRRECRNCDECAANLSLVETETLQTLLMVASLSMCSLIHLCILKAGNMLVLNFQMEGEKSRKCLMLN